MVRDFYHRYTVDEHSLRTIEHLQELADPPDERAEHFQPLWRTVDRRDLLIFACCCTTWAKACRSRITSRGAWKLWRARLSGLKLSEEEIAEVHFLIERHLDMSATMQRRDIFDPATVSGFAASVGNQERLQRLCLLTYADIHAVNPEALTPWKADMLWQLFVATSNHFSRTLDRDRVARARRNVAAGTGSGRASRAGRAKRSSDFWKACRGDILRFTRRTISRSTSRCIGS